VSAEGVGPCDVTKTVLDFLLEHLWGGILPENADEDALRTEYRGASEL
jgi:hypothetical protein